MAIQYGAYSGVSIDAINRAQMSANIIVANEPAGMLDSINMNFDSKRAALNQAIVVPVMPPTASSDFQPRDVPGSGNTNLATNVQVAITKISEQSNSFTGEQILQLENTGVRDDMLAQFLAQSERTFRNEMDAAAAAAMVYGASRAIGTPGTTPFSGDLKLLINARKILDDNGAPRTDRQVVVNTSAYSNMLATNVVSQAMMAGSEAERRAGVIKNQYGFEAIRQSANIADHTAGTGVNFLVNNPGSPVALKTTSIPVDTGGGGTIVLGDVISVVADANNKYVVNPAITTTTSLASLLTQTVTGSGTVTIGNPGLRKTWADNAAITVASGTTENGVTGFAPSYAFSRHCVVGVVRPPMIDSSSQLTVREIKDDVNGITYLFGESVGVGVISWWLWIAYGFRVTQSEYVTLIMG